MQRYTVWLEGYAVQGSEGRAECLGKFYGESFRDACKQAVLQSNMDISYYRARSNTYWGCRFYNNEQDARKSFG